MKSGDLVFLDTAEGSELFHSAEVKNHFWSVGRYFETQLFLTYCGIARS
ncbi:MAG TPA: glutathione gamma-glutamylcysteinyltransferase, partial [Zetaproteobacteria bacterium]|nr:glutathione gamma-glutamylcysteinyltransferase [Zetaproteobacteria bacterium]